MSDDYCDEIVKTNLWTGEEFTRRVLNPLPYTVIYDPLPVEKGGFSKGAKLGLLDVQYGLKMWCLSPGLVIKKAKSTFIVKREQNHPYRPPRYVLRQLTPKDIEDLKKKGVAIN